MRMLCVEDLADALMHAEEILADYRGKAAGGDACARSLYVISDLRSQISKFKAQNSKFKNSKFKDPWLFAHFTLSMNS